MGGERKREMDYAQEEVRVNREKIGRGMKYTSTLMKRTSKLVLVVHEFHILHARVTPSLAPFALISPDPAQPLFHSPLPSSSVPQSSEQLAGWSSPLE